ncbi:S-methyl-5'-thioadenosine phosphorylase [Hansschlegelia sp. KR7-227]|uniref:S-methyl-5'-thioadenosine phosphorylase n=1 Tax=Hansschlegelia sp. KR7-227 TaxID=3400914 RepID=UPI003C0E4D4E
MNKAVLGVIGGSGVYDLPELEDATELDVESPWGEPSAPLRRGRIGDTTVVFLPRHGIGHRLSPTGVNYRANVDALKRAGVTDLVSFSACGSYKADIGPGVFVLIDQFIDRTFRRPSSFFGDGCVAHVPFSDPVAPKLVARIAQAATSAAVPHVLGGAYVCMEGSQFSTRAESLAYKAMGASVVGMTNMPEAKLAREAEISYASVCMVTDFDAWRPQETGVEVPQVLAVMRQNSEKARRLVTELAKGFPEFHEVCPIGSDRALEGAIVTPPQSRDPALVAMLGAIAGRVLPEVR